MIDSNALMKERSRETILDKSVLMFDTSYQKSTPLKSPIMKPKLANVGVINTGQSYSF